MWDNEPSLLTEEALNDFAVKVMDDKAWQKRQKRVIKDRANAEKIINKCLDLSEDVTVPEDVKASAYALACSTAFNGYAICDINTKRKLDGWL